MAYSSSLLLVHNWRCSLDLDNIVAIEVPIDGFSDSNISSGTGFIYRGGWHTVQWEQLRVFGIGLSDEDELRYDQSFLIQAPSLGFEIKRPIFLSSTCDQRPVTQDVSIEMVCDTRFDLASAQTGLWLSAYTEFTTYKELMGGIDPESIRAKMHRKFLPLDCFLVKVPALGYAVLELSNQVHDRSWLGVLHSPVEMVIEPSGCLVDSVAHSFFDEIACDVRRQLATIRRRDVSP